MELELYLTIITNWTHSFLSNTADVTSAKNLLSCNNIVTSSGKIIIPGKNGIQRSAGFLAPACIGNLSRRPHYKIKGIMNPLVQKIHVLETQKSYYNACI